MMVLEIKFSGVARAFPGGRAAHPENQIEEENEEKLRKIGENRRRMRKIKEMVLSCPPEVESLATPLFKFHYVVQISLCSTNIF